MLQRELQIFQKHPRDLRMLLLTNAIYALMIPMLELFVFAHLMRSTKDAKVVMTYQMANFATIPLGFWCASRLFDVLPLKRLYLLGVLMNVVLVAMIFGLGVIDLKWIVGLGMMLGVAVGFILATRNVLVLAVTKDANRSNFYGCKFFFPNLRRSLCR